jgi:hypothetical protein
MKNKNGKKTKGDKSPEKVNAEDSNTQTNEKDKSKKNNKVEEKKDDKKNTIVEKKDPIKFNLDFIYRRERYTLKNLKDNSLVSLIKRKISEKIQVDLKKLNFYYKNKELKEDSNKTNVYEMIKGDIAPFIDVKKESTINQNIISLNSKINLIYKVESTNISNYSDFVDKIEQFFKDVCLEKHYLCEPTGTNTYHVCFSCSDHCFQFKRYMMNISRLEKMYEKSSFNVLKVDKSQIIEPKIENRIEEIDTDSNKIEKIVVMNKKNKEIEIEYRKMKHREDDYFQKNFVNSGPYLSLEEIKKKEEKESKKKWVGKRNFSVV